MHSGNWESGWLKSYVKWPSSSQADETVERINEPPNIFLGHLCSLKSAQENQYDVISQTPTNIPERIW